MQWQNRIYKGLRLEPSTAKRYRLNNMQRPLCRQFYFTSQSHNPLRYSLHTSPGLDSLCFASLRFALLRFAPPGSSLHCLLHSSLHSQIHTSHFASLCFASSHLNSLGLTWPHLSSLNLTCSHLASLGAIWFHVVSFGSTWIHLVSLGLA